MVDKKAQMLSTVSLRERSILKNVYLWMSVGLALTGVVSYVVAKASSLASLFLQSGFGFFILIIAQLGIVLFLTSRLEKMSATSAIISFGLYSIITGITFSIFFYIYTIETISRAFFTTAAMFGGMSLYGMTTKRDLSSVGHYLIMGLWGIIIASVINFLLRSDALNYFISIIGVLLFLGLTAWDTQKIKAMNDSYGSEMDEELYIKLSIMGALILYLDFINIFLYLLRIFGRRRN